MQSNMQNVTRDASSAIHYVPQCVEYGMNCNEYAKYARYAQYAQHAETYQGICKICRIQINMHYKQNMQQIIHRRMCGIREYIQ